ncbi:MAG: DNA-binding domain-containing protein [Balneolaceae bacterium]|nr:DNA-binding domain-containing protein [Balneolaceae bacterium]
MPLHYHLKPNPLTPEPDEYLAVSKNPESYRLEEIFEHATREGSTITTAEIMAVFEEITQGIINILQEGNAVITPLVNIKPTIGGVFRGEDDQFDPNRHRININLSAGKRLRRMSRDIPTRKIIVGERRPEPQHFFDHGSESEDANITPGGGARITGTLLKFDEDDRKQGIFFINTADGSETRVNRKMLKNKPGELIFINPSLEAGAYRLEVRSKLEYTTQIRTGTHAAPLRVSVSS